MKWRLALLLSASLLLAACATSPPVLPEARPLAPLGSEALRRQLSALPGAEIGPDEPLTIRYPGEVLFAKGAALPLPGGSELLDPLVGLLASQAGAKWRAMVRAEAGGPADYDGVLARHRAAVLERYFQAKGVDGRQVVFQVEAGEGPPLELVRQP